MCLSVNVEQTKKIAKRLSKEKFIWMWKVVHYNWYLQKYESPIRQIPIKSGWYQSNLRSIQPYYFEDDIVERGIHVWRTRAQARQCLSWHPIKQGYSMIKVKCYKRDFVAAGEKDAVFTKVWIDKASLPTRVAKLSTPKKV